MTTARIRVLVGLSCIVASKTKAGPSHVAEHKGNKALESSIRTYGLFHTYSSLYVLIADSQVNKDDKTRAGEYALEGFLFPPCTGRNFVRVNRRRITAAAERAGVLATSAAVCVLDGFHLLNSKKHNDMDFKYVRGGLVCHCQGKGRNESRSCFGAFIVCIPFVAGNPAPLRTRTRAQTEASAAGLFALAIACGVKAVSHWKAASDADSKAAAPAKPKSCPKCKGACKCAPAAGAKKK